MSSSRKITVTLMALMITLGLVSLEVNAGKLEKLAALALILKAQQGHGGGGHHHAIPVYIGGGGGGGHSEKKQTVKVIHIHGDTHGHDHGHGGHDFGGHEW